jgi:hypothetical protein
VGLLVEIRASFPGGDPGSELFWFDSIGCALGGSQQEDAKILLRHYRAISGSNGSATAFVDSPN